MKKLKLNVPNCVGCKLCELTCSIAHFNVFSHDISNVHINAVEDTCEFTPYVCVQCEERSCVEACPVGALSINGGTGAIVIDREVCILCGVCEDACPTRGIRLIEYEGEQRLAVCDLCGGNEPPRCAIACREDAIVFE